MSLWEGRVFFYLCSRNNSSSSHKSSNRLWCPSLLSFCRGILFMFQQEKYFCLKLVTFSNLQWKLHILFFLESYEGGRKIMTLLFTIHKRLAEIFKFLWACVFLSEQETAVHTYMVDEDIKWGMPIGVLSILSSNYLTHSKSHYYDYCYHYSLRSMISPLAWVLVL